MHSVLKINAAKFAASVFAFVCAFGVAFALAFGAGTAKAWAYDGTLTLDETTTISITHPGNLVIYDFTADKDGYYTFDSTGDVDTQGSVFDADGNLLGFNDENPLGSNFHIKVYLNSGQHVTVEAQSCNAFEKCTFGISVCYHKHSVTCANWDEYSPFDAEGYLIDGKMVVLNSFQMYFWDMKYISEEEGYEGSLRCGTDFKIDYLIDTGGSRLQVGDVTTPGYYTASCSFLDEFPFGGSFETSFRVFDASDVYSLNAFWTGVPYYYRGEYRGQDGDEPKVHLKSADAEGNRVVLDEGKDFVAYHHFEWSEADGYKQTDGPFAPGEVYYWEIVPVGGSESFAGRFEGFRVENFDDLSHWYLDSQSKGAVITPSGFSFMPGSVLRATGSGEEFVLLIGEEAEVVSYERWVNVPPEYDESGGYWQPIFGEPDEVGIWRATFKPTEASGLDTSSSLKVDFNVVRVDYDGNDEGDGDDDGEDGEDVFNDISNWSLTSASRKVVIDVDDAKIAEFVLTRHDSEGKLHTAKLHKDFEIDYFEGSNYDDLNEDGEEVWSRVETIDGSYDQYRVQLRGLDGDGLTGTTREYLEIENWMNLQNWELTLSDARLDNGKVVGLEPSVWHWGSNGKKSVLDSSLFNWHFTSDSDSTDEVSTPTVPGGYWVCAVPAEGSGLKGHLVTYLDLGEMNSLSNGWAIAFGQRRDIIGVTPDGVLIPSVYVYRVNDRSKKLVEGTDFTVSFAAVTPSSDESAGGESSQGECTPISGKPDRPGEYKLIVTGAGDYSGEISTFFTVMDFTDLSTFPLEAQNQLLWVNGSFADPHYYMHAPIESTIKAPVFGTDFQVSGYREILGYEDEGDEDEDGDENPILGDMVSVPAKPGDYFVYVSAIGDTYHGDTYGMIHVTDKINIDSVWVNKKNFYEGSADFATKGFDLTYSDGVSEKVSLKLGDDYEIAEYYNDAVGKTTSDVPTAVGTYTAYILPKGDKTFGETWIDFTIVAKPASIAVDGEQVASSQTSSGMHVGKITATKKGRYTIDVSSYYSEVEFFADEALTKPHASVADDWSPKYSVDLEAGETVWFSLYYASYNSFTSSASISLSYFNTCEHEFGEPEYAVSEGICTATQVCKLCGDPIVRTGITTFEVTKAPTCAKKGETTYTASFVGIIPSHTWTAPIDEIAEHTSVVADPAVESTCTVAGKTEGGHCEECGAVIVAQQPTELKAHTPGDAVVENEVAATCVDEGSHEDVVYCSVCSSELLREKKLAEKDPSNHTNIVKVVGKDATYKEPGLTEGERCEGCDAWITPQEEIPVLVCEHQFGRAKYETDDETCTAKQTCPVCGEVREVPGQVTSKVTKEPTCVEAGVLTYVATFDFDIPSHSWNVDIAMVEHIPGDAVVENDVKPTCKEKGSYDEVVHCSACGCELTRETKEIDADPSKHVFGDARYQINGEGCTAIQTCPSCKEERSSEGEVTSEVTKAPTCSAKGVLTYTAAFENDIADMSWNKAIAIDPNAHTAAKPVRENVKAATYTAAGFYELVTKCADCGIELSRKSVVVPKLTRKALAASQVKLSTTSYVYNGTARKPTVTITGLKLGTDFTVAYANNVNAGIAKVTVTGKGKYTGTVTKTFTITKANNVLAAKITKKTFKAKDLKKKAKSFNIGASAKGGAAITYKVTKKASKKITVSKSGKVTMKKGAKKGKYVITVTAAATSNYKAATMTVTIKVK